MLATLRELHHLPIPTKSKSKSAPRRPPIEQTPSQEALLPQARISASSRGGYGTATATNEEEPVVEDSLNHDEGEHEDEDESDLAPQTVENLDDPSGTGPGRTRSGQGKKSKGRNTRNSQLSIA